MVFSVLARPSVMQRKPLRTNQSVFRQALSGLGMRSTYSASRLDRGLRVRSIV